MKCTSALSASSATDVVNLSRPVAVCRRRSSSSSGSKNGSTPAASAAIFVGVDVVGDDVVTELGHARCMRCAEVPGPDDADGCWHVLSPSYG